MTTLRVTVAGLLLVSAFVVIGMGWHASDTRRHASGVLAPGASASDYRPVDVPDEGAPLSPEMAAVALGTFLAASFTIVFMLGRRAGTQRERARAIDVCAQILNQHYSGSVRWAINAIASGKPEPMSRDKFFGNSRPQGPPCPPTRPWKTDP